MTEHAGNQALRPNATINRFNLLEGPGEIPGYEVPIGRQSIARLHPIDELLQTERDKARRFNLVGGEVLEGTPVQVVRAGTREEYQDYLIIGSPSTTIGQPPKIHVLTMLADGTFESREIPKPSPGSGASFFGKEIMFGRAHSNSPTTGTVSREHFSVAMVANERRETQIQVTTMATTNETFLLTPEESGILGEKNTQILTPGVERAGSLAGRIINSVLHDSKAEPEIKNGRSFEQHRIPPDGGFKSFQVGPGTNQNPIRLYEAWGNRVGGEAAGRIIGSFTPELSPLGPPRGEYVLIDMTDLPIVPEVGLASPNKQVLRRLPNGETVRGDVALYGEVLGDANQMRMGSLCVVMGIGKNTISPHEFTPQDIKGALISHGPTLEVEYDPERKVVTIKNVAGPEGREVIFYTPTDPNDFGLDRYGESLPMR